MINVHYAIQTCDVSSYQGQKRFASDDRTLISKKCLKSFLESAKYCSEIKPETIHNVAIIDDHSTQELKKFIRNCVEEFSSDKINIVFIELDEKTGIRESIKACYYWLQKNGKDFVYQIQDDYIFHKNAIFEMIDTAEIIKNETGKDAIISPWNDSWLWLTAYRNKSTARTVICGRTRYWISYYDMSCSFFTTHNQFSQHWDLYHRFFDLIYTISEKQKDLENVSLNYMLTKRDNIGLVPINSLAYHLQSDLEKDPHVDYKPLWDSINVT
jgi:hypothetical protein